VNEATEGPRRRRPRYSGKYPRRFEDKYKELNPDKYPETITKVLAAGKTPAGTHVPIMLGEILDILNPQPGEKAVDCTLGYGGHAQEILGRLGVSGCLLGLDVDPIEHPRTVTRLRDLGFGEDRFLTQRANFAGLRTILSSLNWSGADCILADLGVSSMQIDTPARGFGSSGHNFHRRLGPVTSGKFR
jgi:16S rRNA (cytosine1402-N4)-methyltransferase